MAAKLYDQEKPDLHARPERVASVCIVFSKQLAEKMATVQTAVPGPVTLSSAGTGDSAWVGAKAWMRCPQVGTSNERFGNAAFVITDIGLVRHIRKSQFKLQADIKETAASPAVWDAVPSAR